MANESPAESEDPRQAATAPGLYAGRLEGIGLSDLIRALSQQGKTGVLRVERSPITRALYLRGGRMIFVSSSDPNDRLGEMLLRQGKIDLEQLEEALGKLRSGKRLGTLLVESGSLTPDALVAAVLHQVETIIIDTLGWEEGEYSFREGPLPTEEVITLEMKTGDLLLRGIRGVRSFSRIRARVGSPRAVYGLSPGWRDAVCDLSLHEGENQVLERLQTEEQSVEQLCRDVYLSHFEIYRVLWAFRGLGVVEERDRAHCDGEAAANEGRLDNCTFAEVLVRVGRARKTGVLYLSRRSLERSFQFRDGRCVFATSNDSEDGLVAHLFRRGVISMQDREETLKRLLSNKRVGTILREIGAIDDQDLQAAVREQVSEIVYDTFLWDDGDYVFVPGPLPSSETITLDLNVASLVAEGVRRVSSWPRVVRGCGGIDNPLALTPDYLDILDNMGAGVEEWDVVNALKSPRTPRRICLHCDLEDFRISQILWTLKLLGAVEDHPFELEAEEPERLETEAAAVEAALSTTETNAPSEAPAPEAPVAEAPVAEAPVAEAPAPEAPGVGLHTEPPVEPGPAVPTERLELSPDATQLVTRDEVAAALRALPEKAHQIPATPTALRTDAAVDERFHPEPRSVQDVPAPGPSASPGPPGPVEAAEAKARRESAPSATAAPDPTWELPAGIDEIISRFNAMHRIVYRAVRSEIGAGAVNFVRSCCGQAATDSEDPLEGVELQPDGSWDAEALKQVVFQKRISDPWSVYQRLLDREYVSLMPHLGETKAVELKQRIWEIQQAKPAGQPTPTP